MSEVFISYCSEDRSETAKLVEAFKQAHLNVMWDCEFVTGDTFTATIPEVISESKAVVVVWSSHSTKRDNVISEARLAKQQKKYMPVTLEKNIDLPYGFTEQTALDLSDSNLSSDSTRIKKLIKDLNLRVHMAVSHTKEMARSSRVRVPRSKLEDLRELDSDLEDAVKVFVSCHSSLADWQDVADKLHEGEREMYSSFWNDVERLKNMNERRSGNFGPFKESEEAMNALLCKFREELDRENKDLKTATVHTKAILKVLNELADQAREKAEDNLDLIKERIRDIFTHVEIQEKLKDQTETAGKKTVVQATVNSDGAERGYSERIQLKVKRWWRRPFTGKENYTTTKKRGA